MGDRSAIEWTDATWPIVQGCDPVSQGCANCYAVPLLWRMAHNPDPKISGPLHGVTELHVNAAGERILRFTGKIALREDRLDWPLKWKQPRMIFVPSHGDLFHKDVPDEFIDKVFAVMALCPQHTFQVLTKRAERMREYLTSCCSDGIWFEMVKTGMRCPDDERDLKLPLRNVWLGVSCERQPEWDDRTDHLRNTPAAVRFVSAEPLLGHIEPNLLGIHWVIVGGESGSRARPMHPRWARRIRNVCAEKGVPFFYKQTGEWVPIGFDDLPSEQFESEELEGKIDGFEDQPMRRVGKKAAGRLLDGREWNEFPQQQTRVAA